MHADRNSAEKLLGKAGLACGLEVALLGDRSEFRSCLSSGRLNNSPVTQARWLWAVCPEIHHVCIHCRGLFASGLGMMPQKIPAAFSASKIITAL